MLGLKMLGLKLFKFGIDFELKGHQKRKCFKLYQPLGLVFTILMDDNSSSPDQGRHYYFDISGQGHVLKSSYITITQRIVLSIS